jgi:P27 family predicted phage terminase small subunit
MNGKLERLRLELLAMEAEREQLQAAGLRTSRLDRLIAARRAAYSRLCGLAADMEGEGGSSLYGPAEPDRAPPRRLRPCTRLNEKSDGLKDMTNDKPKAPKHLRAPTRRWWDEVVGEFDLESHHLRILQSAAEAWDRCQSAREVIDREGMTFDDRFGQPKPRPEIAIERDSRIAFARLLRELALDVDPPADARPPAIKPGSQLRVS